MTTVFLGTKIACILTNILRKNNKLRIGSRRARYGNYYYDRPGIYQRKWQLDIGI